MRSIILILLATILISGCATERASVRGSAKAAGDINDGQFNDQATFDASRALLKNCSSPGGTNVNLFYGNSEIKIAGVVHLKAGKFFGIRLKPQNDAYNRPGIDYKTETVTISGKDFASSWLTAVGSYNGTAAPHHELVICVPPGQPLGNYYYNIYITNTGSLDPRADVDP